MKWRILSIATADFPSGFRVEVTVMDELDIEVKKLPFTTGEMITPGLAKVNIGNALSIPPGQVKIPKNIMFGYWSLKP